MSISKEQWVEIEEELKGYHAFIKFQYQDTEVCVARVGMGEGKTRLAVYLDGQIYTHWGWTGGTSFNPLVELFWFKRSKSLYTPKQIKELEKIFGKRNVKKEIPNLHDKAIYYTPFFNKASVVVRQLEKIKELTLIKSTKFLFDYKENSCD